MVAEVEGLQRAEMVAQYARDLAPSEVREEISYYRSTLPKSARPKCRGPANSALTTTWRLRARSLSRTNAVPTLYLIRLRKPYITRVPRYIYVG